MQDFFRHLRPLWFNRFIGDVETLPNAGVSFMLSPITEGVYNYWIYICPKNTQFSSRAAVKKLREVKNNDIIPWGTIKLDDSPILNQLILSVMSKSDLPSSVGNLISYIQELNTLALLEKQTHMNNTKIADFYKIA